MGIQALKIFNSIKLILFLILVLGVITVLTACGDDLVKESDTGACDSAIDARKYDEALSVCTSRKDKASAYMGKAGYDIVNLLKTSGSSTKKYGDDSNLGKDDVSGLSILNILQLSVDDIADNDTRATAIASSKTNLDKATALLHHCLSDNCTPPISKDEILLDTFALAFAMQLNQLIIYDNATTSTTTFPNNESGSLVCDEATTRTASELRAMDGHLWTAERDGIQCNRMKSAIEDLSPDNETAVLDNLTRWETGTKLPDAIYLTVCEPILSLTSYLSKLTESIAKLTTLSGDNTKAITDAKTSTDNLTKTVGCVP
jgi:hypothetical protein